MAGRVVSRRDGALAVLACLLMLVAIVSGRLDARGMPSGEPTARAIPPAGDGSPSSSRPPAATTSPAATPSPSLTPTVSASPSKVPLTGAGTTHVVRVPGRDSDAKGRAVRYTVEIEDGAGLNEAEFALWVREVLIDKRGWETQQGVHFVNVSPEEAAAGSAVEVHITLASPTTVDRMCAPLQTDGQVSCRNGNRVALNSVRWSEGVDSYAGDLGHYRIYLINHEVGHALGHDHETCPGQGKPAPVMLQQTLGLQGCTRYPWPVPGQSL